MERPIFDQKNFEHKITDIDVDEQNSSKSSQKWKFFKWKVPKKEIVFFTQVILIYIVVITSIVNLTLNLSESHSQLWIALLTANMGYLLPNPTLKSSKKHIT